MILSGGGGKGFGVGRCPGKGRMVFRLSRVAQGVWVYGLRNRLRSMGSHVGVRRSFGIER